MLTQEALDQAIAEWLARTDRSPDRIRREWATQGVALLPLGGRLAAVRMPSRVVHAAVGSSLSEPVAAALSESLRGPVIHDRRTAGGTYYALTHGHAALAWAYGHIGACLGPGTYLGVPRIDRREPPGAHWVLPPRHEGDLCIPSAIAAFLRTGHERLTRKAEDAGDAAPVWSGRTVTAPEHPQVPWAMRLVSDRLAAGPAPYTAVVLDADSQTARYTDATGQSVDLGRHGTSRTSATVSVSGGGDGRQPQPQTQDDTTTDYESD